VSTGRVTQLVVSCFVLGVGVTLLLNAALGSDGFSTMVNGLHLALDQPFWVVNLAVAVIFVAVAWARGLAPGLGTIVQPVVVGVTVSVMTPLLPEPSELGWRYVELLVAIPIVCLGVAGYLASHLGAGPTEAAALAWDPPLRFKWSYSILQISSALIGWALGAAVGVGTFLVVLLIGPVVDWMSRVIFRTTPEQRPMQPAE